MEGNQELMIRLSMFEQQMRQLQEQMNAVEQGMVELSSLNLDLKDIEGSEGKEIFAPVGRGIFVKAKILSDVLTVDVGNRNFVKKTIPQTQEVINKQILKLEEIRKDLSDSLEGLGREAEKMLSETENRN